MQRFEYIALDVQGRESRGVVEATTKDEVATQLRSAGYFPTAIDQEGKLAPSTSKKVQKSIQAASPTKQSTPKTHRGSVPSKVLMIFTRQLATLIDAGLPLLRGLNVLAKQERNKVLCQTIHALADGVQGGSTFSEAMAQHPLIFNKLYINMVKAGELGGVLEIVLLRLAEFQEKAQRIKNKVMAAMAYPVIVLIIAMVIMMFLLAFIVPKFESIFRDMLGNKPLPPLTVMVIDASNLVKQAFWPLPNLLITCGVFVGLAFLWKFIAGSPKGRAAIDRLALKLPLFGDLSRKSSIARFSRTLGTLVTSGVPILQALNITRDTAGNAVVAEAVTKVHDAVKEGESIVSPLEASGVFPPMVISMVDVGEETGQLPEMLLKIAEVYDDEVDNAVEGLTSLLEPIMIVLLALIVGTIVIALFMPLISIITNMNSQV